MIKVLEEDIVFNELQGDPCKGQSPCVCPNPVPPTEQACPNCGNLNRPAGQSGDCNWACVKVPGFGWRANFVSGCSGSFCAPPDDDLVCANCPTPNTACTVVNGSAVAGINYKQCKGSCSGPPVCNGPGGQQTDCNYS